MEYKNFKHGGEKISLLGLGCMRLPKITPDGDDIDYDAAQKLVDLAYQNGVNYFDTAYFYHGGASEAFVGHALQKYPRESFYLATKMPMYLLKGPADIPRIFEEQLQRCKVDYFDFYLCHALSAEHYKIMLEYGLLPFLEEQKQLGKIRHIGFSFHDKPAVLEEICGAYNWEFAQLQINPLDWDIYESEAQYNILAKRGIPCIVMEPVRGGRLADLGSAANALLRQERPGKSIASWSMRFAGGLPNAMLVLSGMSNEDQVRDNLDTFGNFKPLSRREDILLNKAVALYRQNSTVGCTACRYCMPCPVGVNIPGVFSLYNEEALHKGMEGFREKYTAFPAEERGALCVECGACTAVCPQGLAIPRLLQKLEAGEKPV